MPLAECAALFFATFLHEGVALASGALVIVNDGAPAIWVALSLFAVIVAGDCGIYGLGALARRSVWARGIIAGVDLKQTEHWLNRHMLAAVMTCRVVPGLLFPTFIAFGWFNISFRRFALTSIAVSAIYTPLALFLLTRFGAVVMPYFAHRHWLLWLLAGLILATMVVVRLRPRRSPV